MSVELVQVEILDEQGESFDFALDELLTKAIREAARYEEVQAGEVVVSLVDDATIQELNRNYRSKDTPTDVLSFAMEETLEEEPEIYFDEESEEPLPMLGDIVISVPTAKRQAKEYGHSLEREIAFLAVHGFLHLIGYDHMTEEEETEMFSRQNAILEQIGLTRE